MLFYKETFVFQDIDFYEDYRRFRLQLPKNTWIKFADGYICYSWIPDKSFSETCVEFITKIDNKSEGERNRASNKISYYKSVVSFLYSFPIGYTSNIASYKQFIEVNEITESNTSLNKNYKIISALNIKMNNLLDKQKLFERCTSYFFQGLKFSIAQFDEESYLQLFKICELIATAHITKVQSHNLICFENDREMKLSFSKYVKDTTGVQYSEDKVLQFIGNLKNRFKKSFYEDAFSKLSYFINLNGINIATDSELETLIKIRNKIAHGKLELITDSEISEALTKIMKLAKEMISLYFFDCKHKELSLKSTID